MKELQELGAEVARTQDVLVAERGHLPAVRAHILEEHARQPRRRRTFIAAGGAVALAAALVVAWIATPRRAPLTFTVAGRPGEVDQWIAPGEGREVGVAFSDGSRVAFEEGSSGQVTEVDGGGARILVARGRARVSVRPLDGARWELHVGPFDVEVVGTRFWVAWDPAREVFELSLARGRVRVRGPALRERMMEAGESVQVWVGEGRAQVRTPPPAGSVSRPPAESADRGEGPELESDRAETSESARTPDTSSRSDTSQRTRSSTAPPVENARSARASPEDARWRELVREGRYAEALDSVDRHGFEQILALASASDLLALGDAARLENQHARAIAAYRRARARFPGSVAASTAAFMLGRVAFDYESDATDAARWFSTYLREQPSGRFAAEAAGRLIEAKLQASDRAGARRAATEYLERFPEGPHARLARSILIE